VHGLQDLRVSSHAEIVVGAPDRDSLVLVGHMGAGKFLGQAIDVVKITVGLVLVLLVKLSIEIYFVIEFGSFVLG